MKTLKKASSNTLKLDKTSHQLTAYPTAQRELIATAQAEPGAPMSEAKIEATYPLSSMQQGMLFHSLYQPGSGIDIEQIVCRLPEAIDAQKFLKAWNCTVERHPTLRTRFSWGSADEPTQIVQERVRLPLEQQDWRSNPPNEQRDRLAAYLKHDRQQGFDLTQALKGEALMRFALFQVADADYQFVLTFHHILLDGRSFWLVLQEAFAFYEAFRKGDRLSLESPRPYRDYIEWLRQQDFSASKSFWQQLLQGFKNPTPLLSAQASSQLQPEAGHDDAEVRLSSELTTGLKSFADQSQVTLNAIVQGAWGLLLSRYSGETDVVFGATRACRKSTVAGAESMVGLLINTLPVRVKIDPEVALLPWLKALRSQHVAIRPHENTPLVEVQTWSEISGGASLFESIVMFETYDLNDRFQQQGGWQNREIRLLEQPPFPLVLMAYLGSALTLKISYDRTRFDQAAIQRMLGHLQTMLESMVADPSQRLTDLPLLTAAERHQLLSEWNDTAADYAQNTCLHELFESKAKQTPDAIAVVCGTHLTYRELNQQANQLAHHLKQLGVGAGSFVGVYMNRGLEMIPALLGILKAGGAYIPLEPTFPNARVQWILESLAVRCVVSQPIHRSTFEKLQPQLPDLEHLICLDASAITETSSIAPSAPLKIWEPSALRQLPTHNLPRQSSSDDTAYIIFTSGSTGTPKGVVVCHKPVINLIEWVNRTFQVNACDRVLFITSLCFDLSVYDVFGLLAAGGSIRVVSSDEVRDPQAMLTVLQNEPITFWDSAPPALQQLAPFFSTIAPQKSALRLVFMSGDWVPVTLPDVLRKTFPSVEVVSLGGATEATVWSNFYRIGDVDPNWASIPYGKPIQNAQYYVLDAGFKPCPIGVTGELYIGGDCLASGYTDSDKTAERFIANPLSALPQSRLYRTGDLARFFSDGNIEFLGRIDHQVKIRGFRIELGEIEVVLSQHCAIADSVVVAREDQPGDKRLVAYVVPIADGHPTVSDLRSFLREKLPEYMVPSAIVFLDRVPLTQNGKVDRLALPAPEVIQTDVAKAFVAPQTVIQSQLLDLWQKTLGVTSIGITDNFFEMGGHSLLAVRLVTQIEKTLGQRLPVAAVFQSPTIEQQAILLQQPDAMISGSAIAPIQPNGSKRPLFAIHVLGRGLNFYRPLASHLGPDQPVYGLAAQMSNQLDAPANEVKALATHYIQQMQTVQPQGPYHLAGLSFGGTIAFEMAQQLQVQGQEVALLALLDTFAPSTGVRKSPLHSRFAAYFKRLSEMTLTQALNKLREEWLEQTLKYPALAEVYQWVYRRCDRPFPEAFQDILYARQNLDASSVYVPEIYPGRIVLMRARDQRISIKFDADPRSGWSEVAAGGVKVHEIPGDHTGMLQEPNVRVLAKAFQLYLD